MNIVLNVKHVYWRWIIILLNVNEYIVECGICLLNVNEYYMFNFAPFRQPYICPYNINTKANVWMKNQFLESFLGVRIFSQSITIAHVAEVQVKRFFIFHVTVHPT